MISVVGAWIQQQCCSMLECFEGVRTGNQGSDCEESLKSRWGKQRVEAMRMRLVGSRDEVQFCVLVKLK